MAEERLAQVEGLLILYEGDKAWRVEDGNQKKHWLPKSEVFKTEPEGVGETYTITMSEWLAHRKGLI